RPAIPRLFPYTTLFRSRLRQVRGGLPAFGTLARALGDHAFHALELNRGDQRADVRVLVERVAEAQVSHTRLHLGEHAFGHAFLRSEEHTSELQSRENLV